MPRVAAFRALLLAAAIGLSAGLRASPQAHLGFGVRGVPRSSAVLMKDWSRREVSLPVWSLGEGLHACSCISSVGEASARS
jgi:hypothetical protein